MTIASDYSNFLILEHEKIIHVGFHAQGIEEKKTLIVCCGWNKKELSYLHTCYQGLYIYLWHLTWASYSIVFILFLIS